MIVLGDSRVVSVFFPLVHRDLQALFGRVLLAGQKQATGFVREREILNSFRYLAEPLPQKLDLALYKNRATSRNCGNPVVPSSRVLS
jgi:hypothetical protein